MCRRRSSSKRRGWRRCGCRRRRIADADLLVRVADVACASSLDGLLGTNRPFDQRVQRLRPHPGQQASAANLRALLDGSPLMRTHRESDHAVQDSYSLRCAPQVHGA
ncbi:MAG: hypothetical protein GEV00_24230, partial [Actinophytocola sp.]|nr:hypothetical protein [Actinophytocola sp.]